MAERKRLVDILNQSQSKSIADAWDTTEAAAEFAPLPKGEYRCVAVAGELFTAKSGTAGYKITFEIADGQLRGRKVWHDIWLTPAALPLAKRDLAKLGIASLDQLEAPLAARFICKVRVTIRTTDAGVEYNRVVSFERIGIESADPFAPVANPPEANNADDEDDGHGDAWEPPPPSRHGAEQFPFGANVPNGHDITTCKCEVCAEARRLDLEHQRRCQQQQIPAPNGRRQ